MITVQWRTHRAQGGGRAFSRPPKFTKGLPIKQQCLGKGSENGCAIYISFFSPISGGLLGPHKILKSPPSSTEPQRVPRRYGGF